MNTDLDKALARMNTVMDNLDLHFVEAAHYDRDASYQPLSLAQTPVGGKQANVEVYASTTVPVLAYPVLYCLVHNGDHPCAYTHKVDPTIGVCEHGYNEVVRHKDTYAPSERVQVEAEKSYTGTLTRA